MIRRAHAFAALLGVLAVAVGAGCGEDEQEAFADDYRPLNRQITSLGEFTGNAVNTAERKTNAQIEDQFGQIAAELARLRGVLRELEPPEELADAHEETIAAMRAVEGSLRGIEESAAQDDPRAARRETIELVRTSEDLREARRRLAGETP